MISLTRRYRFPAAHVLASPDFSPEENDRIYGKCANPAGHGHDYGLEVTVTGPVDARSGRIASRDALDALVGERVIGRFGHRLLNDDPAFAGRVPTAENIAEVVHDLLAPGVSELGARLLRVRLQETRRNTFLYGDPR
ncbi:MAG: 6-pyruvoyl trahydropterin synthase family protein [Myxococcota bacterium]